MPVNKLSEQMKAIERHWAGAWEYTTKDPAKLPEACRVIFEAEQKFLKQILADGLAAQFAHNILKIKARNTIQLVLAAVQRHEGPWDAIKPTK